MALTNSQDIPEKEKEDSKTWTSRKLFPVASAVAAITKVFSSPFDVLLGFNILVIEVVELVGRHASFGLYLIAIILSAASILERHPELLKKTKE